MSMRVERPGQTQILGLEQQAAAEKKEADFNKVLSRTTGVQSQQLETFLKRLDTLGKKLLESRSVEGLYEFKDTIKNFLKTSFGKSRTMQDETALNYSGQPRIMSRVTKIDRALEELGEQVLSSQSEPLKLLAKIDEIRGLIIDIFA